MNGATDELRSMPMIDLATAMLTGDDPRHHNLVAEVQRRWDAAAQQQDQLAREHPPWHVPSPELAAIEEARQYLAIQVLIYELWVFQQADVAPEALWADRAAMSSVRRILDREHRRPLAHLGPGRDPIALPDPLGDGAVGLARWADFAIFGDEQDLVDELALFAGTLRDDVLEQQVELCAQALDQLDGPWALVTFMANPVGKQYYLPRPVLSAETLDPTERTIPGLDTALGQRGHLVTEADVTAVVVDTDMAISSEADKLVAQGFVKLPPQIDPTQVSGDHLHRALANMRQTDRLLTEGLALRQLARDDITRVDGRPVARELVPWVMDLHRDNPRRKWYPSQNQPPHRFPGPITIAGLQITHADDPDLGIAAVVRATEAVITCSPQTLTEVLAILDQPAEDALMTIAHMRVHIDKLGRHLAASPGTTNQVGVQNGDQPRATSQGMGALEPPGTAASRHSARIHSPGVPRSR